MATRKTTAVIEKGQVETPEPTFAVAGPDGDGGAGRRTVEEREAHGRSLRQHTPRGSHASWTAPEDRPDPIALLEQQAATRVPELIPLRYARMSASPLAFLRGAAIVMASDLAPTPRTGIRVQLCGDCHLSNFGMYASPERNLLFDINDADETLPGPWEWDVKRLAASIFVAGRCNGASDAEARGAVLATVRSYREHMARFAGMRNLEVWYSRITIDALLDLLGAKAARMEPEKYVAKLRRHDSLQTLAKLTMLEDGCRHFADEPPLLERVTDESLVSQVHMLFDRYGRTLVGAQHHLLDRFTIVDVARHVVGIGSVGTRCYVVLLTGRDEDDTLILQVKEAEASVLEAHLAKSAYAHHGERVVRGLELMQAASDIFLGWMSGLEGRNFYWRQLHDLKVAIAVETLDAAHLAEYGGVCGNALARAHARSSGNAIEIAAYLGTSDRFDHAITAFAAAYADQTERDHKALLDAITSGRIVAAASA